MHVNKNITEYIRCQDQPVGVPMVSTSTDLKAVSVKHRLLYMSTSIECHCCTQSSVVNLGMGKSVRCLDHFRIPVANVLSL